MHTCIICSPNFDGKIVESIRILYRELHKNGWTNQHAIWDEDVGVT